MRCHACFFALLVCSTTAFQLSSVRKQRTRRLLMTDNNRRDFLWQTVTSVALLPTVASAEEASRMQQQQQPYAPSLENLLPACRVRVYIDRILRVAKSLDDPNQQQQQQQQKLWKELEETLLLESLSFMTNGEASSSKTYMKVKTWDSWNKSQSEQKRADPFDKQQQDDPVAQLNEAFAQWGERRQWKDLRSRQVALERSNAVRAAFNAYTNNLVFGESYVFTGSPEERKRRIRNDDLPDITAVIRSDLDLRDLYRNQVLTAVDDAKAELQYQRSRDDDQKNATELVEILEQAKKSCDEWFRFVPEADAKDALAVVLAEQ